MKNKWFILLLVFVFSCKEEQIQDYSLYYKMDKVVFTEYKLRPRKKVIIPFSFNQIYDPFIKTKKGFNNKATYEKGKWRGIKITVLDTIITSMTVTGRVSKRKKIAQAFPVIIENITKKTNVTVPLHRGCANIIQEAQNNKGEWVIEPSFDKARAFSNGLAPVMKDKKWGYINEKGEQVVDFQFKDAEIFSADGLAPVKEKLWGFIDSSGKLVIPMEYDISAGFSFLKKNNQKGFINGLARVKTKKGWGFINKNGELLGDKWYKNAEPFVKVD